MSGLSLTADSLPQATHGNHVPIAAINTAAAAVSVSTGDHGSSLSPDLIVRRW
jgi:hypothetical protein